MYSGLAFCQTTNLNPIVNLFEEDCSKLPIEKKTKYRNASIEAMINTYSLDSTFTKKTNRDLTIFRQAYGDKATDILTCILIIYHNQSANKSTPIIPSKIIEEFRKNYTDFFNNDISTNWTIKTNNSFNPDTLVEDFTTLSKKFQDINNNQNTNSIKKFTSNENNLISGSILDNKTGETLIGANIVLIRKDNSNNLQGTTTSIDGEFKFQNIESGEYTLTVSYIGYKSKSISINYEADNSIGFIIKLNDDSVLDVVKS